MEDRVVKIEKVNDVQVGFRRTKTLIKLALLGTVAVMTLSAAMHIIDNIARVQAQHEIVVAQIAEAEARRQEIENSVAYVESIDFIEYMARRLGLVRRDEIIFIMTTE